MIGMVSMVAPGGGSIQGISSSPELGLNYNKGLCEEVAASMECLEQQRRLGSQPEPCELNSEPESRNLKLAKNFFVWCWFWLLVHLICRRTKFVVVFGIISSCI